ncbi:heme-binding protein [Undibacterium sp. TC9W]|uniref:heme-binding protein n=1 Tax=Undibacterium sp. TC9W TaxID=3413053 RepID=UPI003BF3526D
MLSSQQLTAMKAQGRTISKASIKDDELGPLKLLAGKWRNVNGLEGHGWRNMIALPFVAPASAKTDFRLLLNQYNEELDFTLVDKGVPNRGVTKTATGLINSDQFLAALRYQQSITQIAEDDFPVSGLAGKPGTPIHFEPGLWLHMANQVSTGHDIARISSVPHGNSVLALGQHTEVAGAPVIRETTVCP